jgi:hypothetical protein
MPDAPDRAPNAGDGRPDVSLILSFHSETELVLLARTKAMLPDALRVFYRTVLISTVTIADRRTVGERIVSLKR